jgi:hypothetical protein
MKNLHFLSVLNIITLLIFWTSAPAALIDNGSGLIYDTVLNITWAQPESQPALSSRTWEDANVWASDLTLGGVSGWRLPYISVAAGAGPLDQPVDCSISTETECRDNELGYMYYYNLGGTESQAPVNSGDPNLALFPTLSASNDFYWTGTEIDSSSAWYFIFISGEQSFTIKDYVFYLSWAVHEGNISAVPVPAAVWLFGSGLLGLIQVTRKKAA